MNRDRPETTDNSITDWISHLRAGDDLAAEAIWDRFFERACALAGYKLTGTALRDKDEEDVAVSAMNALFRGIREDRFRQVESRQDLWQVLAMITARRVIDLQRKAARSKEVGESSLATTTNTGHQALTQVPDPESEQAFVESLSLVADELIDGLEEKLRPVALLKLQGCTNEEIAAQQRRSLATIERYLKRIRLAWRDE